MSGQPSGWKYGLEITWGDIPRAGTYVTYPLYYIMYSWADSILILLCGNGPQNGLWVSLLMLTLRSRLTMSVPNLPSRWFPWIYSLVLPVNHRGSHKFMLTKSLPLFNSLICPTGLSGHLAPGSLTKFNHGHSELPSSYTGFLLISKIQQAFLLAWDVSSLSSLHVWVDLL